MSKNFVTIIISLIILVIFGNAFSSSYTLRKIGNLAYVLALGIDVGKESKMRVSAQFTKTASFSPSSGNSSESNKNIILVSGEADSIFGAINLLNSYIGKEINLSHCSIVVFSEEFAKNGISSEILSLMNNEEIRPTTNLVVCKCSAYDYLNNSNPNLEKLTTQYYDTFSITGRFTGYFSNITIGDFYNNLSNQYSDSTAILGGLNSTARKEASQKSNQSSGGSSSNSSGGNGGNGGGSSGSNAAEEGGSGGGSSGGGGSGGEGSSVTTSPLDSSQISGNKNVVTNPEELVAGTSSLVGNRGTENLGIAVFKNEKLCGELTAVETICHLLISNDIDSCSLSVDNPFLNDENNKENEEKLEVKIFPSKNSQVKLDIKNNVPHISIKLDLNAEIMTLNKDINYGSNETLSKISGTRKIFGRTVS